MQARLLFQETRQEVEAVTNGSGNNNGVEARKLVTHEVEVGDSSADTKEAWVGTSIDRAYRNHKAQTISAGDFSASPDLSERKLSMSIYQHGIAPR